MESRTGEIEGEVDGSKVSAEGSEVVEGGKKDPVIRRHELLVDSGLAEVSCLHILPYRYVSFYIRNNMY